MQSANDMEALESVVVKNMHTFCSCLSNHVEKWRDILQESTAWVRGLANRAEQLRLVSEAKMKDMDGFEEAQKVLVFQITEGLENDMVLIREVVEKLNRLNQSLRNKLITFESSSLKLDWDSNSALIKGSATTSCLKRLLQAGLEFWGFFQKTFADINNSTKNLDWYSEENMLKFQNAFKVDLDNAVVNYLLAITQYMKYE